MAVNWDEIATDVSAALASVGSTDAGFPITLRKRTTTGGAPWDSSGASEGYSYTTFHGIDSVQDVRDRIGTLIGQTRRTLTVNAIAGTVPTDDDEVAVGVTAEQAEAGEGVWLEILEIRPLAPAGVTLLYAIDVGL